MDAREERGQIIATTKKLRRKGDLWIVPSQNGNGSYVVDPTEMFNGPTCSCPDFEERQEKCKHVYAVEFTLRRETTNADGSTVSEKLRVTYRQEWPAYNAAQSHEKERVAALLRALCAAIDNPMQGRGRPRLPLSDSVFCAVMKVYGCSSGRRTMTDLRDFAAKGYIDRAPHYNSVFNALENSDLTALLTAMIEESAKPLAALETDFAADSSGFSTSECQRWFDAKYGREMSKTKWLKAHIMIGTKTNVVTSVEITDSSVHDIHMFRPVFERTTRNFKIVRVSADKAYSSSRIFGLADAHGATAYIPFKKNATGLRPNRFYPARARNLWAKAYHLFMYEREEFALHYHKRSNVETTFHMIKSKFGTRIRSKTPVAQVNEVLCKVLCHNLCCLVSAFYELGIEATFWKVGAA
jgi:transposase